MDRRCGQGRPSRQLLEVGCRLVEIGPACPTGRPRDLGRMIESMLCQALQRPSGTWVISSRGRRGRSRQPPVRLGHLSGPHPPPSTSKSMPALTRKCAPESSCGSRAISGLVRSSVSTPGSWCGSAMGDLRQSHPEGGQPGRDWRGACGPPRRNGSARISGCGRSATAQRPASLPCASNRCSCFPARSPSSTRPCGGLGFGQEEAWWGRGAAEDAHIRGATETTC